MCANSSLVKYDIKLDIKILNTIMSEDAASISISNLRNYVGIHSSSLEEHIDYLVKWDMIVDKKPDKNGKARLISLARSYDYCLYDLIKLKDCIGTVNEYFSK